MARLATGRTVIDENSPLSVGRRSLSRDGCLRRGNQLDMFPFHAAVAIGLNIVCVLRDLRQLTSEDVECRSGLVIHQTDRMPRDRMPRARIWEIGVRMAMDHGRGEKWRLIPPAFPLEVLEDTIARLLVETPSAFQFDTVVMAAFSSAGCGGAVLS